MFRYVLILENFSIKSDPATEVLVLLQVEVLVELLVRVTSLATGNVATESHFNILHMEIYGLKHILKHHLHQTSVRFRNSQG